MPSKREQYVNNSQKVIALGQRFLALSAGDNNTTYEGHDVILAIVCNEAGTLAVKDPAGTEVSFTVTAGQLVYGLISQVTETTDITDMVAYQGAAEVSA